MLEKLQALILAFMKEEDLNTYKARQYIKMNLPSPFGVSINTVNKIIKKNELPKSRTTIIKLLNTIEANYEVDSIGNIKFLEDEQEEK